MRTRPLLLAALAAASALTLGACSSSDDAAPSGSGALSVVASTDVYGDVAARIGGGDVRVTSIIDDPSQDPHEYEANARTQLELSKADLVVENGGGYDDFVDRMLSASGTNAPVLNAVDISGKTAPAGGDLNEHVWYDFPTIVKVADQIATRLGALDPSDAATFTAHAKAFDADVARLQGKVARIRAAHAGEGVAITEPVPLYLLENAGLVNRTPEKFSEAAEEGTDVAPSVLLATTKLFSGHHVEALVDNAQTSGPSTTAVLAAAKDAGIPTVPVTETLPDGKDYISWMTSNVDALAAALGS